MGRKHGFTLIEIVVVIIIVGILAALGFTQYTKVVEKGRTAEAKSILGALRTAQRAYNLERGGYANNVADLPVEAVAACTNTHYFRYSCFATGACTATRCTGATGKQPGGPSNYTITLDINGNWSGTPGYY
ncbi:MAG: prepilin-type N-terminal cleavage/methylation domain-containing protein [Candidatus Omnitrophota bacterium]